MILRREEGNNFFLGIIVIHSLLRTSKLVYPRPLIYKPLPLNRDDYHNRDPNI